MNIMKEYEKTKNKHCVICKKLVLVEDIITGNAILSITKRKSRLICHKNCLMKEGAE